MNLFLKLIIWVALLFFCTLFFYVANKLYIDNHFYFLELPKYNDENNRLANVNYTFQIGYNILYITVAIVILFVAYDQLKKTREATNISSLTNVEKNLNSDLMCQKRKELAELILANCDNKLNPLNNNGLKEWVNQIPETEKRELTEQEIIEIAIIKNKFEAITYQFEILGYYYYKNIYSRKDIYELFSYELQRYWLLVRELGFIKYLRDEKKGGEKDFYDKFEKLYKKTLNKEAFLKTKLKLWKFCEIRNSLEQEKIKKIGLFLIEEMNIS